MLNAMETVKLYRGVAEVPKLYVPAVQTRHEELERKIEQTKDLPFAEGLRESLKHLAEVNDLRRIAADQHFTDDEEVARDFASKHPNGHLMVLEIPKNQAEGHFKGMQHMAPKGTVRLTPNFVFSAQELLKHAQAKRLTVIDMASGKPL